jgi:glucan phosphoethanolaminetransferase (alkaline phosphatase superfamily)
MIQRVQSFWLLLAAAAAVASIKLPFYTGSLAANNTYESLTASENIPIVILTVLIALISLVAIFLYKNRNRQTWITLLNIFLSIVVILLYFLQLKNFSSGSFSLTSLFVFAVPVFLILALMGIRRDAKLIKSLDRLR